MAAATLIPAVAQADPIIPQWLAHAEADQFQKTVARDPLDNPLWGSTRVRTQSFAPEQLNLAQLTSQSPVLMMLRDWRNTLRGTGAMPLRKFSLGGGNLDLEIGARPLPMSELASLPGGSAPSLGFTLGKITIGSTVPTVSMNRAFAFYDTMMNPADPFQAPPSQAHDETTMSWMMAKPFESKHGLLELMYVRGHHDLTPTQTTGKQFMDGTLWGTRGNFTLTPHWKLRGEYINSSISNQPQATTNWKLVLDGGMRLPFGHATVAAYMNDVDSNFASFMNPCPALGHRTSEFTVLDTMTRGNLSGTVKFLVNRTGRKDVEGLTAGTSVYSAVDDTTTNFTWKLSRHASMTLQHISHVTDDAYVPGGTYLLNSTRSDSSDLGLQYKLTKPLTLTVGVGRTSFDSNSWQTSKGGFTAISLRDDARMQIALQRQTSHSRWCATLVHNSSGDDANHAVDGGQESLLLEGEHQLRPWLKLHGSWRLAQESLSAQQLADNHADRCIDALFDFKQRGQLKLRYSDWNLDHSLAGLLQSTNTSAYGIEYNVGVGPAKSGFGFTFGYYKYQVNSPDTPRLKLMLNYR
jgi:hypothetical protein